MVVIGTGVFVFLNLSLSMWSTALNRTPHDAAKRSTTSNSLPPSTTLPPPSELPEETDSPESTDPPPTKRTLPRTAERAAGPAGEAAVPANPVRYPAPPRGPDDDPEARVWYDAYTSVLHVRLPAYTPSGHNEGTEVEMRFPLIHVRDRTRRTVAVERAYAAGERRSSPSAASPRSTNSEEGDDAFVLPLTVLDAAVRADAETLRGTTAANRGSPYKRWQRKLSVRDAFEIPSWASAGEQNTLDHASIFISLAAYRDRECAATAYDLLTRSASPHRLYFGISDERDEADEKGDLSCLAGILHGDYRPEHSMSSEMWSDWRLAEDKKTEAGAARKQRDEKAYAEQLRRFNAASKQLSPKQVAHVQRMLYGASLPHQAMPLFTASFTWESLLEQHNAYYEKAQQRYAAAAATGAATPPPVLYNFSILKTGAVLSLPVVRPRPGVSSAPSATDRTNVVPRQTFFLDDHYDTDRIFCVGGEVELARDRYLLDQDVRLRYAAGARDDGPVPRLRRGRGGSQERALEPLAGCRVTARTAEKRAARGPTYGRYVTSLFYFNQDFYMMIDSHSRFAPHFDRKFIVNTFQVAHRGVLSHYPNGYVPSAPAGEFDKTDVMRMCTAQVLSNGMPKLGARWRPFETAPIPEAFAAAGFLFGDAQYVLDVPFDPLLPYLFDGEEIMYSARLWTNGWNILCPSSGLVFHYYGRATDHRDWRDNHNAKQLRGASERRVLYLLQRYHPWAQTMEQYAAGVSKAQKGGKVTQPPPAYESPATRRIVTDAMAEKVPYYTAFKKYFGIGDARSLEDYWEFTELTDKHITKRDNEHRWMGGEGLCARKVEDDDVDSNDDDDDDND
ncbi:UDP-GlcNAc:polypeptide alpha-N-acetylglucosaminyltransferase [Strigomonas culicis]|uniref:UDP-GlcNAc:polypeptide alpha-N-acetylglucosaminyltransferase n=1 Tax=Strigomonas culicis TaxID=28005 RepID=S9UC28_9TRYP|nr:UDP-GlcNAc:polypeptide alpha-N-acetylglucosaminyltransferase [Strigomonas culicis]|eukprot:EPY26299.1 UDP-GlcNAc:polypeptide alpha-N-acetylglucosaminyltransferase [Strigomonas culicis]